MEGAVNAKIEPSKIKLAIQKLHNNIAEVTKAIDSLRMKIEDVVTPFQGELGNEDLVPAPPPQDVKSNLLNEIHVATNNLADLRTKIYSIEKRIEL